MEPRKPRHIRDIAHLYISRMEPKRDGHCRRVIVVSSGRDCFSGFHVAGLEATLASRGRTVRVVERSGLLFNTPFFFGLPAATYAKTDRTTAISVARGVTVSLQSGSPSGGAAHVRTYDAEIWHLPTMEDERFVADEYDRLHMDPVADRILIVCAGEVPAGAWLTGLPMRAQRTLLRLEVGGGDDAPASTLACPLAGKVERWTTMLRDPVPAVLRDSSSVLARSYAAACARVFDAVDAADDGGGVVREPARRVIRDAWHPTGPVHRPR